MTRLQEPLESETVRHLREDCCSLSVTEVGDKIVIEVLHFSASHSKIHLPTISTEGGCDLTMSPAVQ